MMPDDSQIALTPLKVVGEHSANRYIGDIPARIQNSGVSSSLIQNALRIITLLDQETQAYQHLNIPPMSVSSADDGEILIGWAMPPIRIGFSIEADNGESSWYAVTDGTIDATNAWGYVSDYESDEKLISFLVSYVIGIYRKYK